MLYLYAASMILVVIFLVGLMAKFDEVEEENLMEDIPTINLSKEDLEKHAMDMAYWHCIGKSSNCRKELMKSLDRSYYSIISTYKYIDKEVQHKRDIVPAAEWLLDNLYIVEREYKDIKHNMPEGYYRNLPVIKKGILKCYPRIYHIAVGLVSHTDGRIDESIIESFISSYQHNSILTTGELWAFPMMLRMAIIQNISSIAGSIAYSQKEKMLGDSIAERIINAINNGNLCGELDRINKEQISFSPHFTESLLKVLRDNGVDNSDVFNFIDEKLECMNTNTERIIVNEHQKQAGFQLSMGNCITSLRAVEAMNWRVVFENLSYVQQILSNDPSAIYEKMDFESRDYYRHKIEKYARKFNKSEGVIAKKAIECAQQAETSETYAYKKHVGYYIIDEGIEELKAKLDVRTSGFESVKDLIRRNKVSFYIGTIAAGTLTIMMVLLIMSFVIYGTNGFWKYIILTIAAVIPCSEIIVSTFNYSINRLTSPKFIPKLELKDGIPEECRTIVVIPTLLNTENRVHDLISDLEVYYLANAEKNIYFALLGDFSDSMFEAEEKDNRIVEAALNDIKVLNDKYCQGEEDIFFFFNRYRQYNEKECKWLGWERKRGKLMEFNDLLRGNENTSYNIISSDISNLKMAKYIITLDADTQLPRDTAKKLIGAMCHVLNKPIVSKEKKKVERGYGLMQPRISVGTISANKTAFSKIFSGETGIDVYTTAVSDVYQDLFGEGIFTGKGIYDIDVFEQILKDEIPENAVLSHDLLEGSYVRTGLVTDIELVDGYPAYYNSSSMRLHRWVRGDWQLLPWLTKSSPLNGLSKWKMIDNLRRSLLSPSLILLILVALVTGHNSNQYLILAFLGLLCPIIFDVSDAVVTPVRGIGISGKINNFKNTVEQFFLLFCFLPYNAYLMLDAIFRTLYRLYVSKSNLLEWQTAADVEVKLGRKLKNFMAAMWPGSLIALAIGVISANYYSYSALVIPCILWFIAPVTAYYISLERKAAGYDISKEAEMVLRKIGRRTWAYFEDFVNNENNYLAPDNYQEDPNNGVAPRTSPTNMGMGLTSNITAFDFGYIGLIETVERIDKILSSMEGLQRYKGHFYNWYDTVSKEPLRPEYVSTVDSGNLVGYLWLVSEALREYSKMPLSRDIQWKGMCDTLQLANEEIEEEYKIADFYSAIISESCSAKLDIVQWKKLLIEVWSRAIDLEKSYENKEFYWHNKVKHSISRNLSELQRLFPWVDIIIEAPDKMRGVCETLKLVSGEITLENMKVKADYVLKQLDLVNPQEVEEEQFISQMRGLIESSCMEGEKIRHKVENLCIRLENLAEATDFTELYDEKRQLFSIGYDIERESMGNSYYDLLASESRQASFVAIAKGDVEQRHWFKLGRSLTLMNRNKGLVSWSGTMFEYFMPLLIMRNYPDTLLNQTYKAVIEGQKSYCRDKRVPWGISESAYHNFDANLNYQYKAFGVPGIGLKRGLNNELVISPYSTVLALQADFKAAYENILRLVEEGYYGRYGFYEAVDYTKERLSKGKKRSIIKCFMVHHQGMSLMALDNVLNRNILQERFHRIPAVKATELLLQERVPRNVVYDRELSFEAVDYSGEKQKVIVRAYNTALTEYPEAHLFSNGSYSVMLTNSGCGYSKKDDMTIYRWREDATSEVGGMFFYIKNLNSNEYWSAAYEPVKDEGEDYEVIFSLDKAEFKRKDGSITTHTQIAVSNEDDAEVRKITLTNCGEKPRKIEVTSYCEVTLAPYNADIVHPTFSNLFIGTEFVESPSCLIASRRPRAKGQHKPFVMQTAAIEGEIIGTIQYETSRLNFIGRGRDLRNPIVMEDDAALQNTTGAVLDPIISMRIIVKLEPGRSCTVAYTTGSASSREEALDTAKKYREMANVNRVFELSWTQSTVEMKYLGIKANQANLYQVMSSKILFLNSSFRERKESIMKIDRYQRDLWRYGISGDIPIVLLLIRKEKDVDFVRQLLYAHEYWSVKGLKVDLIILNLQRTGYMQPVQDSIRDIISSSHARDKQNKQGGVFLQSSGTMSEEDINLLTAIARIIIEPDKGSLLTQINGILKEEEHIEEMTLIEQKEPKYEAKPKGLTIPHLEYFNEYGGFKSEDNSYVIRLRSRRNTPAPWINVISNGKFGFHVSESGSSYTWYKNSRENKITPWSNDPISDTPGELLYLRDDDTGTLWSITPKPSRDEGDYIIEYGYGYANFKHETQGISGEINMFVPLSENVKVLAVKLKNNCDCSRELSLAYYAQMVMGVVPQNTAQYISTYLNEEKGYIYARNPYSEHFGSTHTYLKVLGGDKDSFTGNRAEFIGRGGSIYSPKALRYRSLSNSHGAGYDPCISAITSFKLGAWEEKELVVLLGCAENTEGIDNVINAFSHKDSTDKSLKEVRKYWSGLLGKIKVKTPDKSMDIMLNGWLMYQTIVCRLWARTAFYQSGGAYGFRDQLQDVMAVCYLDSSITRSQILYSASRQFVEGDVQHWWHPVVESGIRTRFSDDLLWLPYVTADYIKNSGDYSILEEEVNYLEDETLKEGEDERYKISPSSESKGTIYEHCIRAIERALNFGPHNIPLMGSGDWNDGMSTVGNHGKGESVWLGWFLYSILDKFKDLCLHMKDEERAASFEERKEYIRENIEQNAWDGGWYRRAYFDDGTPLGSMRNDECQIDSLAQSWAAITKAGRPARVMEAMGAVERRLIKEELGIVQLLSPPFDKSPLEPGYIKGYVPGVRENGAQYTHAAVWVILAQATMGQCGKAWRTFSMINPINHSNSYLGCERYKVEPYVMSADVYIKEPHSGRGGWSWYTGASGWMYRTGVEGILGLKFRGKEGFAIEPCIPEEWNSYEISYTNEKAEYIIRVKRGDKKGILVDGIALKGDVVPFYSNGVHKVEVII